MLAVKTGVETKTKVKSQRLPLGNGLIPQAPLHVRALAKLDYEDSPGGKREVYRGVVEKRWFNLLQSIMCLLTVFLYPLIKCIPVSVLSGTFLYMGASGFYGNGLFDRLSCMAMEANRRPDFAFVERVPWDQVAYYTKIQAAAVVLIFFVSFNFFLPESGPPIAVVFPLIIAVLIPLRESWLPTQFTEAQLAVLDPGTQAEDAASKQEAYARTRPSLPPDALLQADRFTLVRVQGGGGHDTAPATRPSWSGVGLPSLTDKAAGSP